MQNMQLYKKSLATLELPAVLEMLAAEAVSEPAKEQCRELFPADTQYEISRRLKQTSVARDMMVMRSSPSFSGVKDVRGSLARADMGGMLNTRELLDIAALLQCARGAAAYAKGQESGRNELGGLFGRVTANKYLEEKITTAITGEDEIADIASHELSDIRRKIRAAAARVREVLQKIISSPGYAKALQEPIITTRSERYVVPVKTEHKNEIPGLVHDISASGATVFIEPMGAVKANNEIRELRAKEKIEIERILMELSAECAGFREDISASFLALVELDAVFARAKLSYKLNCVEPVISSHELVLKNARHPLLDQTKAVPINVSLGGEYDTLVITGPNTGGKTVSIKTMGLLSAMAMCGLHIPASDGSSVPVFSKILSDIGDEQSIEQSLSTFSSHMRTIVDVLKECDDRSLLLLDELGAGTDPTEGAALAISIIERARQLGAMIAATTHYAELKVYATTQPGVQNASCEFSVETLKPTYHLLIGIPGKSNAFEISRHLGLPEDIIADAKSRVGAESASMEEVLEKLERQRQEMEREKTEISRKLREAEENAKQSARLKAELTVRLEKADERSRREAQAIIDDARREAERVFDELDRLRKLETKKADHNEINEARAKLRRGLNEADEKFAAAEKEQPEQKSARAIEPGDTVQIKSMGIKAQVLSVSPDRTLQLQAGIMKVSAREDEVLLLENQKVSFKPAQKPSVSLRDSTMASEIDIRGMMTDEGVAVMERYIDSASLAKLKTVTIIHGKGTGALRAAVQQALRRNSQVKSFRPGKFGEGEMGVTVVELK